jgi:hypothetical protein
MWYLRVGQTSCQARMIKGLSLVDSTSGNPIDHYGTKNTFHNLILRERHDPHPGQVSTRDRVAGEEEKKESEGGGYNSLFPCTFCLVTDPVNESRITRRHPRFDIQVDPVNMLSDRDPRCCSGSKTPPRPPSGSAKGPMTTRIPISYTSVSPFRPPFFARYRPERGPSENNKNKNDRS